MAHVLTMQEQRDNLLTNSNLIADCARLARRAEWWGAKGQSKKLAVIANHLARGDIKGAANARDEIITEMREARLGRALEAFLLGCAAVIGFIFMRMALT